MQPASNKPVSNVCAQTTDVVTKWTCEAVKLRPLWQIFAESLCKAEPSSNLSAGLSHASGPDSSTEHQSLFFFFKPAHPGSLRVVMSRAWRFSFLCRSTRLRRRRCRAAEASAARAASPAPRSSRSASSPPCRSCTPGARNNPTSTSSSSSHPPSICVNINLFLPNKASFTKTFPLTKRGQTSRQICVIYVLSPHCTFVRKAFCRTRIQRKNSELLRVRVLWRKQWSGRQLAWWRGCSGWNATQKSVAKFWAVVTDRTQGLSLSLFNQGACANSKFGLSFCVPVVPLSKGRQRGAADRADTTW